MIDQPPGPMAPFASDLQVDPGVEVHVAHTAPDGNIGAPLFRIVPQKIVDRGLGLVEWFQAGGRIRADEAQFEVDSFSWLGCRGAHG